jgi:hypothetical protein
VRHEWSARSHESKQVRPPGQLNLAPVYFTCNLYCTFALFYTDYLPLATLNPRSLTWSDLFGIFALN